MIWHGLGREFSLELVPMRARLQWAGAGYAVYLPAGKSRCSLGRPLALAGEREEAKAQIRRERRGCFLCVSDEEGWAGPEHWMWHSLGAEQFLKCCVLPQTLGLGLEKKQFYIKFCPFQLGKVPALD